MNCGNCLMDKAEIVALRDDGSCPSCGPKKINAELPTPPIPYRKSHWPAAIISWQVIPLDQDTPSTEHSNTESVKMARERLDLLEIKSAVRRLVWTVTSELRIQD